MHSTKQIIMKKFLSILSCLFFSTIIFAQNFVKKLQEYLKLNDREVDISYAGGVNNQIQYMNGQYWLGSFSVTPIYNEITKIF